MEEVRTNTENIGRGIEEVRTNTSRLESMDSKLDTLPRRIAEELREVLQ
jgi:hypothetical protein